MTPKTKITTCTFQRTIQIVGKEIQHNRIAMNKKKRSLPFKRRRKMRSNDLGRTARQKEKCSLVYREVRCSFFYNRSQLSSLDRTKGFKSFHDGGTIKG